MSVIKRFLTPQNELRMGQDFKFLNTVIDSLEGEFDLFLRDNYFSIYYRGNSVAKVEFRTDGKYTVRIHPKFYDGTIAAADTRFVASGEQKKVITLSKDLLHPFFQRKHLESFAAKIKAVNHSEELYIEQQIINENRERSDIIIIDRQVQDHVRGKQMDLLALRRTDSGDYHFMVLEIKLGNNRELAKRVGSQIEGYMHHVGAHFDEYKACYEKNYVQSKRLGIIKPVSGLPDTISIVKPVEGVVIVVGYAGMAQKLLHTLNGQFPPNHRNFQVKRLTLGI